MRAIPRGFTLVELLVALTILALISVLSWRGMDGVIRARDAATAMQDRTLEINASLEQLAIDLRNSGPNKISVMAGPEPGMDTMVFSRSVPDPSGAQRQVQVQWQRSEQRLNRITTEAGAEPFTQAALGAVQSMSVRIYSAGRWLTSEEIARSGVANVGPVTAVAVALKLKEGEISRTLLVGGL